MITFKLLETKPETHENYFERIVEYMDRNLSSNLGPKAEHGRNRSERGYQLTAASTCRQLARALGANEAKTEALSLAAGMYFPQYGQEGLKVIKEYIKDRSIDLNPDTLGLTSTCYIISNHCFQFLEPTVHVIFYDLADDYFSGRDQNEESKIVRLVQNTIMNVKKAEVFYDGAPGDLLYDVTNELVALAKDNQALTKGTLLEPYREKIENYKFPPLSEAERKGVYQQLDQCIDEFCNYKPYPEYRNETPEEVVLEYIVGGILCR